MGAADVEGAGGTSDPEIADAALETPGVGGVMLGIDCGWLGGACVIGATLPPAGAGLISTGCAGGSARGAAG